MKINFPDFLRNYQHINGKNLPNDMKLVFHHIPKTAGSTLRGILSSLFETQQLCPAETVQELEAVTTQQHRQYRFYAGHFSYGSIKKHLSDALWLTFLREPNERVVSQYYNHINNDRIPDDWKRRVENTPQWKEYKQHISGMTLEQWVTSSNKSANSITCNRQVQAFLPQSIRVDVKDWSVHDAKLVEIAKKNLTENFVFFGIQEYFELSLQLFFSTFGMLPVNSSSGFTTNTNNKKAFGQKYELSQELSELITSRNSMDWELYHFAVELFMHRASSMLSELTKVDRQTRLERRFSNSKELASKQNLKFNLKDSLSAMGFYALEGLGDNSFRWSGADKISSIEFAFPLEAGRQYEITLKTVNYLSESVIDSLQINFDKIAITKLKLSRGLLNSKVSKISFTYSAEVAHSYHLIELTSDLISEDIERRDARSLGLAVSEISIECLK